MIRIVAATLFCGLVNTAKLKTASHCISCHTNEIIPLLSIIPLTFDCHDLNLNRSHYDYKEMANIAFCQLCQMLNQPRTHLQWYHDIDAWYDGGNHCHKPNRFKVTTFQSHQQIHFFTVLNVYFFFYVSFC